jgi:transposase
MTANKDIKLLTELLNLEGVKVISHSPHQGIGIILQIESKKKEGICPRCSQKSRRLHQNHRLIVKDLPWGESPVFLSINRRQFKCETCSKPFSEELEFIQSRRTYTKRLAQKVIERVLKESIHSVAQEGVVTAEEIERMLKDASSELSKFKPDHLKKLGIDEIALVKGQGNYCAVLIDLESSKLLAILPARTQTEIEKVLMYWGIEVLEKIEEVSIDLWKGYKTLAERIMPNAQVVADRFHVMMQVNQELDGQRKREKRQAGNSVETAKSSQEKNKNEKILEGLKKSKYTLLKNEKDLTQEQIEKLAEVKSVSSTLKIMHELKEEIRQIFEQTDGWFEGLIQLGGWLSRAPKYFPKSQSTILRWLDEVISYFDHRTTNGVVEGINNKIKLIKRAAYGFRNFENFQARCWLHWHFNC